MTAIVATLNKHAVAIAADSAVTFGNTHKVVNTGNKIFTLSKYEPVAIMTYNNATFMGIPWDIIIKEYRKNLYKTNFDTIELYKDNFIEYLQTTVLPTRVNDNVIHQMLSQSITAFYIGIVNKVMRQQPPSEVIAIELLKQEIISQRNSLLKHEVCAQMATISFEEFRVFAHNEFDGVYSNPKLIKIPNEIKNLFEESCYYLHTRKSEDAIFSGLVFVGYGDSQIFPSLRSVNVSCMVSSSLKYYDTNNVDIQNIGITSCVIPYAQKDVMQTLLDGINPTFKNLIGKITYSSYVSLRNIIINELQNKGGCDDTILKLNSIDLKRLLSDTGGKLDRAMADAYTRNLINTIGMLNKEDLADMAESFISLTSLVRRMSPGEETVGGPVDVAVISKGDGFIWIKRKHYFQPEFNNQFFYNYNR